MNSCSARSSFFLPYSTAAQKQSKIKKKVPRKQLGWNCFDIAIGIEREELVDFALAQSKSIYYRQLLAPEIRHAATLAVIQMNNEEDIEQKRCLALHALFEQAELIRGTGEISKLNQEANVILEMNEEEPALHFALPSTMKTKELQDLVNQYGEAYQQLRGYVSACNEKLALPGGRSLSIEELDHLPVDVRNSRPFFEYEGVYQEYKKARASILNSIENKFIAYSESEQIYCAYIKEYYAANNWVAFQREFAGERATSMVDIAARMCKAKIIIFQEISGELQAIYQTDNFSEEEKKIVFNGMNHFYSYEEYIQLQPAQKKLSSDNKEKNEGKHKLALSKNEARVGLLIEQKGFKKISCAELIERTRRLLDNFENQKSQMKTKLSKIKSELDQIKYYFNCPDLIFNAIEYGGIDKVKYTFAGALLRIEYYLSQSTLLDKGKAEIANKGLSRLAQRIKIKRAYTQLYKGVKFKKAGLGLFDPQHPITQPNPIISRSKLNILRLIAELKKSKGDKHHQYGLRDDEQCLFKSLMSMPYRLQHATNHYYSIVNTGSLDSYAEIQRRCAGYASPFSTPGNVEKLGNDGFIFLRLYIDGVNSSDTRYGDTSLIFDTSLLAQNGCISLHDQLKPFPGKSPNSKHFYWGKRLLRTAKVIPFHAAGEPSKKNVKDKNLWGGIEYSYRYSAMKEGGKSDTLKSFGKQIKVIRRTLNFLDEIFYGKDILLGISLSIIHELRYLEQCGFRKKIITSLEKMTEKNKILLLGELLKGLFRVEGKYPVSLKISLQRETQQPIFNQIASKQSDAVKTKLVVINPDGDGRYNVDMSENSGAMKLGQYKEKRKKLEGELQVARRQRGRIKDKWEHYSKVIQLLKDEIKIIEDEINKNEEIRNDIIRYFSKNFKASEEVFKKNSTSKLECIKNNYEEVLENENVTLLELLQTTYSKLRLLSNENLMNLIVEEQVSFKDLVSYSEEMLEILGEYDIGTVMAEHDKTIQELIELYQENPMHLACLSCDDLSELILDMAPDVDPLLIEYAQKQDVDFEWIEEQLGETDAMLFRLNLNVEGYAEESEEYSEHIPSDEENEWYEQEELSDPDDDEIITESDPRLDAFLEIMENLNNYKTQDEDEIGKMQTKIFQHSLDSKYKGIFSEDEAEHFEDIINFYSLFSSNYYERFYRPNEQAETSSPTVFF